MIHLDNSASEGGVVKEYVNVCKGLVVVMLDLQNGS